MNIRIACLAFVSIPSLLEAKSIFPSSQSGRGTKDLSMNCVQIEGIWEGSCKSGDSSGPARVQIFQDGCSRIAFNDFENPIPIVYGANNESLTEAGPYANSFANTSRYSKWSTDGKTFTSRSLSSSEFTIEDRRTFTKGEENFSISSTGESMAIELSGTILTSSPEGDSKQSFSSKCDFKRSNSR